MLPPVILQNHFEITLLIKLVLNFRRNTGQRIMIISDRAILADQRFQFGLPIVHQNTHIRKFAPRNAFHKCTIHKGLLLNHTFTPLSRHPRFFFNTVPLNHLQKQDQHNQPNRAGGTGDPPVRLGNLPSRSPFTMNPPCLDAHPATMSRSVMECGSPLPLMR